ncbi:hypothetical protein JTB14_037299 [Gonioctena quinquepunctata]|nr:hypothetical protein JTB14_037299 [Gonioctena quinquepunctata]
MAANAVDSDDRTEENAGKDELSEHKTGNGVIKIHFKCCSTKNKRNSTLVCIKWFSFFHVSCVGRMSKITKIDDSKVICCDGTGFVGLITQKFQNEITLLRKLIFELEEKSHILKENNGLLLERIAHFEAKKACTVQIDTTHLQKKPQKNNDLQHKLIGNAKVISPSPEMDIQAEVALERAIPLHSVVVPTDNQTNHI